MKMQREQFVPSKLIPGVVVVCTGSAVGGTSMSMTLYGSDAHVPVAAGTFGIIVHVGDRNDPVKAGTQHWLLLLNDGRLCWANWAAQLTVVDGIACRHRR